MVLIVKKIWDGCKYALKEYSHPLTRDWFLANPLVIFSVLLVWLYFCLVAGPRYMKNRKPFQLKNTMMIYNFFQICISIYVFYEGGVNGWLGRYSYVCQPIGDDRHVANLVWLYLFCKLTELLDTIFFVLRKKDNQISTLHIFHHTLMPFAAWMGLTFAPGGHGTFVGWINTFVHIIMYGYYLVAGLGPEYQKYLWWKKHLTALQLIQFVLIFMHNFLVLFRDCDYPKIYNRLILTEALIFIYMFGSFYYKSYVKKSSVKKH
ncbi:GNS1/SUR4 family domain-containing protein [Phthorimaea operculella]|nr:GNS1/SUR4 family domain-containing protein [Phthorimaea operculella]